MSRLRSPSLPNLDVRISQLESFVVLTEELHFGRAATRLGIAQSALSMQVRRLEEEFGAQLLTRTSRRVTLTVAGAEIRDGARSILADIVQMSRRACAADTGSIGTARVCADSQAMLDLVPRIVSQLRNETPELGVTVSDEDAPGGLEALAGERADVGFMSGAGQYPGLRFERIDEDVIDAMLPTSHALAARESIDLGELSQDRFVLRGQLSAPVVYEEILLACRSAGFLPTVSYVVSGSASRQAFVAAGLGVALEPRGNPSANREDVCFVELRGHPLIAKTDVVWKIGPSNPRRDKVIAAAREKGWRSTPPGAHPRPVANSPIVGPDPTMASVDR